MLLSTQTYISHDVKTPRRQAYLCFREINLLQPGLVPELLIENVHALVVKQSFKYLDELQIGCGGHIILTPHRFKIPARKTG